MSEPTPEIVHVPFHGDDILAINEDGKPLVLLKPLADFLGVDYWSQVEKLRKRSWAAPSNRQVQLPGDTQRRSHLVIDARTLGMLLATIDENRVAKDVRPKLITYQAEAADAIHNYFVNGGAINPRATHDQLSSLAALTERRIAMLRLADGLVDRAWLEAKTRHEIARGLGEEPELDANTRPLTVGEYLTEKGVTGAALRSLSGRFGRALKTRFIAQYGHEPAPTERFVDGALRQVAGYTEQHRPLFDQVSVELIGEDEGLRSIPLSEETHRDGRLGRLRGDPHGLPELRRPAKGRTPTGASPFGRGVGPSRLAAGGRERDGRRHRLAAQHAG